MRLVYKMTNLIYDRRITFLQSRSCRGFPPLWRLGKTWRNRKKIIKENGVQAEKETLMDLVQERRAQKPTGPKWDLINSTGPLLEVVDAWAETTVEGDES